MPTFPIALPKQFIIDLLEYLKHAYEFLHFKPTRQAPAPPAAAPKVGSDGILTPTLAPNHPQLKQQQQPQQHPQLDKRRSSTFDDVLNAYNRSKSRKKLETDAQLEHEVSMQQAKYDYAADGQLELHITMVLRALIAVIKTNAEVEIQCIGNFDMIFGFLANNIFPDVCMK